MDISNFQKKCTQDNPDTIVQKYLIEGSSYFFDTIQKGDEYIFKKDIANILNVHIRDIVIVGSGKLGFSLKPNNIENGLYLFKNFDHEYLENPSEKKSDLDIAIISSSLFDKEIKNLFDHTEYYRTAWPDRNSLAKYSLKGKLAIRFLPIDFPMTKEILKAQEKYQMKYGREVNIEIYKSWYFFETYHKENIKNIQVNLLR